MHTTTVPPSDPRDWRSESGVAMILALFMIVITAVLATSMMTLAQSETLTTLNYKTVAQARYAAESGIHSAANYLLGNAYNTHLGTEPITASYDRAVSPVTTVGGAEVVLSTVTGQSTYPLAAVVNEFATAASGDLSVGSGTAAYSARAKLLSLRLLNGLGGPAVLQTWEITGIGRVQGAGAAEIEVSAIIEREVAPVFTYAAFATSPGCEALKFGGGARTDSYDSSEYKATNTLTFSESDGNVGTNGNLTESGSNVDINGSLSTPRSGVGECSESAVTAATLNGAPPPTGGMVELPQEVEFPTPPALSPLPPTNAMSFGGGCPAMGGTNASCVAAGDDRMIMPASASTPVVLGDVRINGNGKSLTLKPGTYIVNSLQLSGGTKLVIDVDPNNPAEQVIIKVAGQGFEDASGGPVVSLTGGSLSNETLDPSRLQFIYGGEGAITLAGGAKASSLIYAPNATAKFQSCTSNSPECGFYGAVVAGKISDMGGAAIHYDRNLDKTGINMPGNPVMTSFTWSSD